jgi:hypothetical protein
MNTAANTAPKTHDLTDHVAFGGHFVWVVTSMRGPRFLHSEKFTNKAEALQWLSECQP